VTLHGEPVELTVREFRLLRYFMTHPGVVIPPRELLREVWGQGNHDPTDVVRVTVHRLRRKLEADPAHPQLLVTLPGVGLLFKPEPGS
jgi:two-component system KDP operon response regulator KdpE